MRCQPCITLTTDFGLQDAYVAEMKGVILSQLPNTQIIDISHEIPSFDILKAALIINQVSKTFPEGTIHVVVVDPGVGGDRKPLMLKTRGQFFIGPDNGVFTLIWNEEKNKEAYEIFSNKKLISYTFHGRDLFAPSAATLARGESKLKHGPPLSEIELIENLYAKKKTSKKWIGCILDIDKYGNLVTTIPGKALKNMRNPILTTGKYSIRKFINTFCAGEKNHPGILVNSQGYLEIVYRNESAYKKLKLERLTPVVLEEGHKSLKKTRIVNRK